MYPWQANVNSRENQIDMINTILVQRMAERTGMNERALTKRTMVSQKIKQI